MKSVAVELIQQALPDINFQVPNYKIEEDIEEVTEELTLKDKINMSDRLFQVLENRKNEISKQEFRTFYERYKKLKNELEQLKHSANKSDYPIKRLEANVNSIRRILKDIGPEDLE